MRQSYRSDCLIKRFIFCLNVQRQVRILYKKRHVANVHFTYDNPRRRARDRRQRKNEKSDAEPEGGQTGVQREMYPNTEMNKSCKHLSFKYQ